MLKNIIFALLALIALVTTSTAMAADEPPVESEYVKALTADNPPEKEAVKEPTPQAAMPAPAKDTVTQAPPAKTATQPPAPVKEAFTQAAPPKEAVMQAEQVKETVTQVTPSNPVEKTVVQRINSRPEDDGHADYRYCLDLKTNIEIIKCRYKK